MWNGKNRVHLAASKSKKCGILLSQTPKAKCVYWNMGELPPMYIKEQSWGNKCFYSNSDKVSESAPLDNEITAEAETV